MSTQFQLSTVHSEFFRYVLTVNNKDLDSLVPVSANQIACFNMEDKAVLLYTLDGQRFVINESLDHLESLLDPDLFFRANRQSIISSEAIVKVHYYFNYKLKIDLKPVPPQSIIVSRSRV